MLVRALGGIFESTDTLKLPDDEAVKIAKKLQETKNLGSICSTMVAEHTSCS